MQNAPASPNPPWMENTSGGPTASLRHRGIGRWFGAAFLMVWLCGWAMGEAFAIGFLAQGIGGVIARGGFVAGRSSVDTGAAIAIGTFLLFWLALWTLGGMLALRDLGLRLWAEDRVTTDGNGISIERRRGPFRMTRRVERSELRDVRLTTRGTSLVAETATGTVPISALGMTDERAHVAAWLRRELRLEVAGDAAAPALPAGWQEIVTPEGAVALIADPKARRRQAWFVGIVGFVFAALTVLVVSRAASIPGAWPGAVMLTLATAGLLWGAWRLAFTRTEWRIGQGRIVQQRRSRHEAREDFVAVRMELTERRDSDGDVWIALEALSADAPATPALTAASITINGAAVGSRHRRRILSMMNDAATPRRLGAWISRRTDVPLVDLASPEARAAELIKLKQLLEQSGGLGRLASRWLDRIGPPPR